MTGVQPTPFLVRPWQAGVTGWVVVFGAVVVELIAGVVVNTLSVAIAAPVLIVPAAIAVGFGIVQWFQARSAKASPVNWWHLGAIAVALFVWAVWPVTPGVLLPFQNATDTCGFLYTVTPGCVALVKSATSSSHVTWWVTGALIIALASLARRSRIGAWAAIPVAFAGCQLAGHFLELLLVRYHAPGS